MARRVVAQRPYTRVSIGDLRNSIEFFRTVSFPGRGGRTVKRFTSVFSMFSKVETIGAGPHLFNGVNRESVPTHSFTVRFSDQIDTEMFVQFKGSYYAILQMEDIEGRGEYQKLTCIETGDVGQEASRA